MNVYSPAKKKTMYFIGVTTKQSSIMKVFPAWMKYWGIDAEIKGFDFKQHDEPAHYRECVEFIKNDPLSLGALVTTHKLDCYQASKDLFDGVGPYTKLLGEASSISKRGKELWAHAKDPITSGLALERIMPAGYFEAHRDAQILILGAGGSSLALSLYLIDKAKATKDAPSKIIITNRSQKQLDDMKAIHEKLAFPFAIEYKLCASPEKNDEVVASLSEGSLVVNATGLGKDAPGSPLTDAVSFPMNCYVWEFNYRGERTFMKQAQVEEKKKNLTIVDGWEYFIFGWIAVISEVFHMQIPTSGPEFEKISQIAQEARVAK